MKKYKIAIVGAGNISKMHLNGYKNHPDIVEVTSICDPNSATVEERANEYTIPAKYTSLADMIQAGGFDIAVVCTPTNVRKDVLLPLINAKIPVFCEKPFADTLEEAQEITEKSAENDVPITINQNFRNHYIFDEFKELINKDAIGNVKNIIFNNIFLRHDIGWRNECKRHALSVMGIHWLDGFRWMLGCEAKSIACTMSTSAMIGCLGETDANVQIKFANGAMATYTQSFSSIYGKDELIAIGDKGTLVCLYGNAKLYTIEGGREPVRSWQFSYDKPESAYDGLKHLIDWIETGVPATNSAADNLKTVSMLEAAYLSAKENRIVEFDESGMIKL